MTEQQQGPPWKLENNASAHSRSIHEEVTNLTNFIAQIFHNIEKHELIDSCLTMEQKIWWLEYKRIDVETYLENHIKALDFERQLLKEKIAHLVLDIENSPNNIAEITPQLTETCNRQAELNKELNKLNKIPSSFEKKRDPGKVRRPIFHVQDSNTIKRSMEKALDKPRSEEEQEVWEDEIADSFAMGDDEKEMNEEHKKAMRDYQAGYDDATADAKKQEEKHIKSNKRGIK